MQFTQSHTVKAFTLALLCLLSTEMILAQSAKTTPQVEGQATAQAATAPANERAAGALRIRAWPKVEGATKRLERKRFFLIKGSLAENGRLVEKLKQTAWLSRDCYYRSIGASEALIKWLRKSDCESVYCREVAAEDLEGSEAVPEFQLAYRRGQQEFNSPEAARKWLPVNLRADLRDGFYKRQQETLRALIKEAEAVSQTRVQSVMTDRKGSAYFTDIEPGTYVVSNLVPAELGSKGILWNCEIEIKPRELSVAMKRPFLLTNAQDAPQKCFIEEALPPCAQAGK